MNKYVKIKSIIHETNDAFTIKFENDPIFNSYKSGQFINVFANINGEEVSRSYSFSSSPKLEELPAITIKRVDNGLVSNHLYREININENLLVSEPLGRFELTQNGKKYKVFIAGGSGITPIFSMIKTTVKDSNDNILLLYANQNIDSIIFKKKLLELQDQYLDRLEVIHFLEKAPIDKQKMKIESGRIDKNSLKKLLPVQSSIDSFYLCGSQNMMENLKTYLLALGISEDQILTENFSTGPKEYTIENTENSKATVKIVIDGKPLIIKADKSKPILQSALEQGFNLPHSCQEALCGSCKIKLLKGKVNMVENYALADNDVSNGMVLLCSSLPDSDEIELSY